MIIEYYIIKYKIPDTHLPFNTKHKTTSDDLRLIKANVRI